MKHRLINTSRSLTLKASALASRYVCPPAARPAGADPTKKVAPPMPAQSGEAAVRHLRQVGVYDSLSAALAATRYEVEERKGVGYEASNPRQNFRIVFITEGVEVRGASPAGLGWRLGMRLSAYGYGERKEPVAASGLKAEGERVEYDLRSPDGAGLSEWYVNRAEGLEHGFTVPRAPGNRRAGEKLSLWLSLSGDLKVRAKDDGRAILLEGRGAGLRYDSLHAYDATGRELPSRMMLSGGGVKLEVSDEGAIYPVTIDPTLVKLSVGELKLEVQYDEAAHPARTDPTLSRQESKLTASDRFGESVATSRDTVVVEASNRKIGDNSAQGATHVSAPSTINPITVNPTEPVLLLEGKVGQPYNLEFTASGGTEPFTFAVTDETKLPPGLTLDQDGILSGTPADEGSFTFIVQVTDHSGAIGQRDYALVIKSSVIVNPTDPNLPDGTVDLAYNLTFTASGGTTPYTFAVAGTLPTGLTLDPDGTLSGTPTDEGSFTFTVQATDAKGDSGQRGYTLVIKPPVTINPTDPNLPAGSVDLAYNLTFTASGGTAPFTFAVAGGTLPAGLTLNPNGTLSGRPTTEGAFTFTVKATDDKGAVGQRDYTLVIKPALTIIPSNPSLPTGTVGAPYNQTFTASGGTAPYTFAVVGTLPAGLTLDSGGTLSGTPTAAGVFTFIVRVTDADGGAGQRDYRLAISPPPTIQD
jgi:hypothetical protein